MHDMLKFIIKKIQQFIVERKIKKKPAYIQEIIIEFSKTPSLINNDWKNEDELPYPKRVIQKCIVAALAANHTKEFRELLVPLLVDTLSYHEFPSGVVKSNQLTEPQKRELEKMFLEDVGYCYLLIPAVAKLSFTAVQLQKYDHLISTKIGKI